MRSLVIVLSSGLFAASLLWSQSAATDGFSPLEWAIIKTLSPLPDLPVDTTNKYRDSAAAALLGQKLFFEPRLSGPIQTGTPAGGQLGPIGEKYIKSLAAIAICPNRNGSSTFARTIMAPSRTRLRWAPYG